MVKSLCHSGRAWPGWGTRGKGRQSLQGGTYKSPWAEEREGGSAWRALEAASASCPLSLGLRWGLSRGSQRRRALVEAEKQSDHIHTIRMGWLGGASVIHPSLHAPSDPPQRHSKLVPLRISALK